MAREFQVTWTAYALDVLVDLIRGTKRAVGNSAWVQCKYEECVLEAVERLELFPDLRLRYVMADHKCGAMTLRALPVQVFYRQVARGGDHRILLPLGVPGCHGAA